MPTTKRRRRLRISNKLRASSRRSIPTDLNFMGTVELRAGKDRTVALGGERLLLLANTGRPMQLEGFFDPVIIDLKGARFDKDTTPIIADHNTSTRIGHTTDQLILADGESGKIGKRTLEGPLIAASGVRSSTMGVAKGIVADLKNGYPFQVSVGAKIVKGYFVEAGDTVEVNGKTWKGPLIVASRTRVRELSVLVLGADSETSTKIAARKTNSSNHKDESMGFKAYCRSQGFPDTSKLSAKQLSFLKASWKKSQQEPEPKPVRKTVKAGARDRDPDPQTRTRPSDRHTPRRIKAKANRGIPVSDPIKATNRESALNMLRISDIQAAASDFSDDLKITLTDGKREKEYTLAQLQAKAIKDGWSAERFELACRRADYPAPEEGPAIQSKNSNIEAKILECAILRAAQTVPMSGTNKDTGKKYGIETLYDEEVLEASDQKKYIQAANSLDACLDIQIRAAGKHPTVRTGSELMSQAHQAWLSIKASAPGSTLNLVNVFENVMHKASYTGFQQSEGVWSLICGRRPLNDFKPHSLYVLEFSGSYRKVAQNGELKHVGMTDTKHTLQADTYGAMIAIDRKTQINDDLGVVVEKARSIGVLAGLRIEESVFVLLLSNPGSFFSVANGNLISGGGSVLGLTALATARQAFRDQVVNGKPVTVTPTILLTGTSNEVLANNIFREQRLAVVGTAGSTTREFTNNEFVGQYRPVISPYLNNTAITDQDGGAISGQSSTQWYLLAPPSAPQGPSIVIGFLNGRETPYFDEAESQFNVPGGIQFRSYMDWGVAMHVHQMALKSAGA